MFRIRGLSCFSDPCLMGFPILPGSRVVNVTKANRQLAGNRLIELAFINREARAVFLSYDTPQSIQLLKLKFAYSIIFGNDALQRGDRTLAAMLQGHSQ